MLPSLFLYVHRVSLIIGAQAAFKSPLMNGLICLFIQHVVIKYLHYVGHSAVCWGYRGDKMDVIPATMETGAGKQMLHCSVVCATMGEAGYGGTCGRLPTPV